MSAPIWDESQRLTAYASLPAATTRAAADVALEISRFGHVKTLRAARAVVEGASRRVAGRSRKDRRSSQRHTLTSSSLHTGAAS